MIPKFPITATGMSTNHINTVTNIKKTRGDIGQEL